MAFSPDSRRQPEIPARDSHCGCFTYSLRCRKTVWQPDASTAEPMLRVDPQFTYDSVECNTGGGTLPLLYHLVFTFNLRTKSDLKHADRKSVV